MSTNGMRPIDWGRVDRARKQVSGGSGHTGIRFAKWMHERENHHGDKVAWCRDRAPRDDLQGFENVWRCRVCGATVS